MYKTDLLYLFVCLSTIVPALCLDNLWVQSSGSNATCWGFYATVPAKANNTCLSAVLGGTPGDEEQWAALLTSYLTSDHLLAGKVANAPSFEVSENYTLWFEYCQPCSTPKGVFLAVHGVDSAASYWNVELNDSTSNSFALTAASAGWATLAMDRLGVGKSDHPDGIDIVQSDYQVAQLSAIASMLRNGEFMQQGGVSAFDNIIGIGHSYGSALLSELMLASSDALNGSVLTGYPANASSVTYSPLGAAGFAFRLANVVCPARFANLSNDYLLSADISADQQELFHYPNYTREALDLYFNTKAESSIGEFFNAGSANSAKQPEKSQSLNPFTAPVLLISGQYDAPSCNGNCSYTSLGPNKTQLDIARQIFPNVSEQNFQTHLVPDTGHGINYHTTAFQAYQVILQFVEDHL